METESNMSAIYVQKLNVIYLLYIETESNISAMFRN